MMREQLKRRLAELKAEFGTGRKALDELEAKQANTRDRLLRIGGAIQVWEEELAQAEQEAETPIAPMPAETA